MRRSFLRDRPRVKHINRSGTWPSGNPRLYFRPKGQKGIALPDLPADHPEILRLAAQLLAEHEGRAYSRSADLRRTISGTESSNSANPSSNLHSEGQ